ncbi:hypothetical protein RHSP_51838 [Rhizobium freirei PRF 81]|uniref:Uncharacterized protein n=1 Tax=Rhizobium freirei PRF 81 TaxID=363754 RepID=N6U9L0_9HYPH|nr:hypothetical protein RHSP_51838 [Rhizobium freirei PRF 81]
MHRIAGPHDLAPFLLDSADETRQVVGNLVVAETADERQAAGLVLRVQNIDQVDEVVRLQRRTALEADRVLDAAEIFDMRVICLARAVADPEHVARGRVPVAGGGVDAGESLFVAEQQCLMAGEEIGFAQARIALGGDADRAHEIHGLADTVGELTVTLALRAVLDEAEHPLLHIFEVGIATHRKGAQQVQRRGRLAVSHQLALGIGNTPFFGEIDAVDDVAAIARQRDAILRFDVRGARLGELAGDTTDLHHRQLRAKSQHDGHLQEGAEEVADVVRAVFREAFGAITALQQEAVAFCNIGQMSLQTAGFASKNQRRIACELGFGLCKRCLVRKIRHLLDRFLPPTAGCPILCHITHLLVRPVFAGRPVVVNNARL